MNKFLIAMFCGWSSFTGVSQGLITFANTPETLISVTVGGNTSIINGPVGSYYFALLISCSPSGPFAFPDVYATNVITTNVATAGGGQFDGGTVLVPGWQPGTRMFYLVAGWYAPLGTIFQPNWLSGSSPAGLFCCSEVGSGIAGGGPQNLPPLQLFGGTGITSGFGFNQLVSSHFPVAPIIKISTGPTGVVLTWPSGNLQQANEAPGPYGTLTNASSPYVISNPSPRKF